MTTDIFLVGLAGLTLIAVLILALTSRKTRDDTRRDTSDRGRNMARDGRSS